MADLIVDWLIPACSLVAIMLFSVCAFWRFDNYE